MHVKACTKVSVRVSEGESEGLRVRLLLKKKIVLSYEHYGWNFEKSYVFVRNVVVIQNLGHIC
jgi:hypothetical protein